ncbi:MAG: hypothetical protein RJA42_1276 [Bacteroidota bacterium]
MFSFLETICIQNGQAQHLDFHQMRVNETFEQFFQEWEPFDVEELVAEQVLPTEGTHRLRITYQEDPETIEILPYTKKEVNRFALVDTGEIDYDQLQRSPSISRKQPNTFQGGPRQGGGDLLKVVAGQITV